MGSHSTPSAGKLGLHGWLRTGEPMGWRGIAYELKELGSPQTVAFMKKVWNR